MALSCFDMLQDTSDDIGVGDFANHTKFPAPGQAAFLGHLQRYLDGAGFTVGEDQIVIVDSRDPKGKPFSGVSDRKFLSAMEGQLLSIRVQAQKIY